MVAWFVSLPNFGPRGRAGSIHGLARGRGETLLSPKGPQVADPARDLARLAQAEAQRGTAGVRFHQRNKTMRLVAHVASAEHGIVPELALDREHVLFGVGNTIADGISRDAADGLVLRPIDVGIGMAARGVQGREVTGNMPEILSVGGGR